MPEQTVPLEELLEAAEAAVEHRAFRADRLVLAAGATVVLLVVVAVTLGIASGGRLGQEARLLELVAPSHVTPEAYRSRVHVEHPEATFRPTPFGTQEIVLRGALNNRGDRVLDRATVTVTIKHLFRDEVYHYAFDPVTPGVEGLAAPGPLLAHARRPFSYRIPDFPADVARRDVRIAWEIATVQFHEGLPIPVALPPAPA